LISNLTETLVTELEQVEISAWSSFYSSPDDDLKKNLGIYQQTTDNLMLGMVSSCDILGFNRVIGAGLDHSISRSQIDQITESYRKNRVKRFFVQITPGINQQRTVKNLGSYGLTHYNNWVKLYRQIAPLNGIKSDLEVKPIDRQSADFFAQIVCESFGWSDKLEPWIGSLIGKRNWHHYMAFDGGKPVATAAFYKHDRIIWIDFAATKTEYRGRGAQSALLKRRFEDAMAMNCELAIVETAQQTAEKEAPSYRNMVRYGFKQAYIRPNYIYVFDE
jgi:predicted GNAT family acetyltransferase